MQLSAETENTCRAVVCSIAYIFAVSSVSGLFYKKQDTVFADRTFCFKYGDGIFVFWLGRIAQLSGKLGCNLFYVCDTGRSTGMALRTADIYTK